MFPAPTYPTPLMRCEELSDERAELWVKNDGFTHPVYGGNKVRRAEGLVREALRRGARRIFTVGAVGSHHVLTMALFAKAAGLGCAAVLVPQPRTEHVVKTIRVAVGQGLEPFYAGSELGLPLSLLLALERSDYFVPPGGSNLIATSAYASAVGELAAQLSEAKIRAPDWIVVPLGSGGTAAGIAAGVIQNRLPSRVLAVQVYPGSMIRAFTRHLFRRTLRILHLAKPQSARVLTIDPSELGDGYGFATPAGDAATRVAARIGLELDQTYTAKTFAAALRLIDQAKVTALARSAPLRVLYWHTLNAMPLEPLLASAPLERDLPVSVRRLLRST